MATTPSSRPPRTLTAEPVVETNDELGEGPVWDEHTHQVCWLDVEGQILHRWNPATGDRSDHPLERRITCLGAVGNGWYAGAGDEVVALSPTGEIGASVASIPISNLDGSNDGGVDPLGRLWVGTVDRTGNGGGALSVIDFRDESVEATTVRRGISMSNGIGWTLDGGRGYYTDTFTNRVDTFTQHPDGSIGAFTTFVEIDGMPDGLTVDAEDAVWVALWDGRCVHRYLPDGTLDTVVHVDGGFTTSCVFGADSALYITTAWAGMTDEERSNNPQAGMLFAVDTGVTGVPERNIVR